MVVQTEPSQEECCLELNFATAPSTNFGTIAYSKVEKLLPYEFLRLKLVNREFDGQDPALRFQSVNGFSPLMGGGETVPAFRSGINTKANPIYGYQAIDFVINALMTNPSIQRLVVEAQERFQQRPASILCIDKKPGTFMLDSDHYYKKVATAPRLESIKGKPWAKLTYREKKVVVAELMAAKVVNKKSRLEEAMALSAAATDVLGIGTGRRVNESDYNKTHGSKYFIPSPALAGTDVLLEKYWNQVYPSRDTLQKATDYPWRRLTESEVAEMGKALFGR